MVELDPGVDDRDVHRRTAGGDARVAGAVRGPGTRAEDPVGRDLNGMQRARQLDVGDAGVVARAPRRRSAEPENAKPSRTCE